ncbi:MAG: hypothetical protein EOO15_15250 [Chitinophagaceae bacterium]|nr:MAG: hypothetical protein EOO15_15250 [Chitinophagaceae bacterium]
MRRLYALCCLMLLLLTMGGRSLFFELRLAEIRGQMRASIARGLQPEEAKTFSFTSAELEQLVWLDGGDEFEWKGERYDVLARRNDGGCLVVQAISDKEETALLQHYRGEQNGKHRAASDIAWKLAALNFLPPHAGEVNIAVLPGLQHFDGEGKPLFPQAFVEGPEQPPRPDRTLC